MAKAKRHVLVVEITDMAGTFSTRSLAHTVLLSLRNSLGTWTVPGIAGVPSRFQNIQVKDKRRVDAAAKVQR